MVEKTGAEESGEVEVEERRVRVEKKFPARRLRGELGRVRWRVKR